MAGMTTMSSARPAASFDLSTSSSDAVGTALSGQFAVAQADLRFGGPAVDSVAVTISFGLGLVEE